MNASNIYIGCVTLVIVTFLTCFTFYKYSEMKSLERNVESAIVKGIDPVAVRCAYSISNDLLCMSYTASSSKK